VETGENRKTGGEKTSPNALLPSTNPTWTDLRLNAGLRGERSETIRPTNDTAKIES